MSDYLVHEMFITPVVRKGIDRPFTAEELDCVRNLPTENNIFNTISSVTRVLDLPAMKDIKVFVEQCIQHYRDHVIDPLDDSVELYLTDSWCNYTTKGQQHHTHTHPNSFISGVLYLQTDEHDKVEFFNNRHDMISIPPREWNPYNSESWWIPAVTGDLLMFPSYAHHKVEKVATDHTRISLAFNTFVRGNIGDPIRRVVLR